MKRKLKIEKRLRNRAYTRDTKYHDFAGALSGKMDPTSSGPAGDDGGDNLFSKAVHKVGTCIIQCHGNQIQFSGFAREGYAHQTALQN